MCATLNYIEHLLTLTSVVTGSLLGIRIGFTRAAVELKICVMSTEIRMYKSIIKKHDKIVLLAKNK